MNTLKTQLCILFFVIPSLSYSQNAIEPYIGLGLDVNNKTPLTQLNIGLQYPVISNAGYQLVIGLRGAIPIGAYAGTDVAYSPDPLLPLSINAGYETKFYSIGLTVGNRFKLISWADKNTISLFVNAGVIRHNIKVQHDSYDKESYTILNPHKTIKKEGAFLGGGVQYKYKLNSGHLFFQVDIFSPPIIRKRHSYSYENPVPLSFNAGYIFEFKKRRK